MAGEAFRGRPELRGSRTRMRPNAWLKSIVLLSATVAPAAAAEPKTERPYLLERVDDAAVARIYADGFAALPLEQKVLIWHLYQAAVAGRDIYYDQRYAHGLEMRDVLEAI